MSCSHPFPEERVFQVTDEAGDGHVVQRSRHPSYREGFWCPPRYTYLRGDAAIFLV